MQIHTIRRVNITTVHGKKYMVVYLPSKIIPFKPRTPLKARIEGRCIILEPCSVEEKMLTVSPGRYYVRLNVNKFLEQLGVMPGDYVDVYITNDYIKICAPERRPRVVHIS